MWDKKVNILLEKRDIVAWHCQYLGGTKYQHFDENSYVDENSVNLNHLMTKK